MKVLEPPEFQTHQRSEDRVSYESSDWRPANYSEDIHYTDLNFGMQGSLMRVVEPPEFQKTSEVS